MSQDIGNFCPLTIGDVESCLVIAAVVVDGSTQAEPELATGLLS